MKTITFKELGLSAQIVTALEKKGFSHPTEIQAKTIPLMLSDECDIIGQAQTGTGKTAAFGLPIIESLEPTDGPIQALVMTPTRELTLQVTNELISLKGEKKLTITPIYGGQSIEKQAQQLRKRNDIVVGTPGRLIDHMRNNKLDLSDVSYVVLDEADEMLNSGFIEDIELILSKTNPDRKTLLFSATMPESISMLAKKYMKNTTTLNAKKETLATTLTKQTYYEIRESDKLEALCRVIDITDTFYGLIFCRTKRDVDTITEKLINRGYKAEAMHGDLSQFQRERVLSKFRQKICSILVVTDVASRGLDISGLTHVINYALPQDAESYVHRVGRTGRAGQSGTAISFATPSEGRKLSYIQKVAKTDITKEEIPSIKAIVEHKQNKLKATLLAAAEIAVDPSYVELAETLLQHHAPKDALASIIKIAFENEFTKNQYADIKPAGPSRRRKEGKPFERSFDRNKKNDRFSQGPNAKNRRFSKDRKGPDKKGPSGQNSQRRGKSF